LDEGKNKEALQDFLLTDQYPENQQIGRDPEYIRLPEIYYYIGSAYEKNGNMKLAKQYFQKAGHWNGPSSWNVYFKGLALKKLGEKEIAELNFEKLHSLGEEALGQNMSSDFFAKFGKTGSDNKRLSHGHFILGLYFLEKGDQLKAKEELEKACEFDASNLWSKKFLESL
jgi:tetratricopeptide (TPR) repeat protein